jgi:hypothetical protein
VHLDADQLTLLALGEPAEDEAATDHLAGCPDCLAELAALTETVALARAGGPDTAPPPPPGVWAGIAARLDLDDTAETDTAETDTAGTDTADPHTAGGDLGPARGAEVIALPWWRRTAALATAAALALLVALGAGWLIGRAGGTDAPASTVVSSADLRPLPDSPEQAAGGSARIQRSADGSLLVIDATGLPAPDGFYEVWLFDPASGAMVPMGNLDPSQRGTFPMPPNLDPGRYPVVDISAEKFDNDPEHSEVSVLRGELNQ